MIQIAFSPLRTVRPSLRQELKLATRVLLGDQHRVIEAVVVKESLGFQVLPPARLIGKFHYPIRQLGQ